MTSRKKAIFYDLDNTLYPQVLDIEQRIDLCIKMFSFPDAEKIKAFWVNEWLDNGPAKDDIIDRVISKFLLSVSKGILLSSYKNYRTTLSIGREVYDFLVFIKSKDVKQFLITNGSLETQMGKINTLGLEPIFDEIVVATGEHAKPSNFWFLNLMNKYILKPEECISIGDWYNIDGLPSISAGIAFIHITGGPIKEKIPHGIMSVDRIVDIVGLLNK